MAERRVRHVYGIFLNRDGNKGYRLAGLGRVVDLSIIFQQTVPDWRLDEFFLVEQHQMALAYDQTPRHPLTVNLSVFQDVDIFDTITYSKAATVLKMLRDVVGEKVFKTALNIYLSENQ